MKAIPLIVLAAAFPFVGGTEGEARGSGAAQAAPADRWKIDFKLNLAEKDGKWVYSVEGSTNLPADTVLRARVYVLNIVNDPIRGLREDDDEALVREDEGRQPGHCSFKAGAGWFHQDVYAFSRKPYSIRYRAKIHYRVKDQTPAITLKVGGDDFDRQADLRAGSDDEYAKELKDRCLEIARDLAAAEKLGSALFAAAGAPDPKAWDKAKGPTLARVEGLRESNLDRYDLWAIWIEGRARMYVDALCELLERYSKAVERLRWAEEEGNDVRVASLRKAFHQSIDEAYDRLGIDGPLDASRAGPIVAAYEKALAPLRSGLGKPAGETSALRRKARHDGLVALFDLPPLLEYRRRGYQYLNEVSVRLTRFLELAEAGAAAKDLEQALRDHDATLVVFKKYAGLE